MKKSTQIAIAFVFGVIFVVTLVLLAIFFPNPTPFQYTVFRVVLALAAAGTAAMVPGFIQVNVSDWLRAGGALAVFVIVFFYNPATLVTPSIIETVTPIRVEEPHVRQAKAFEITWLAMAIITGNAQHPAAAKEEVSIYLHDLGITIDKPLDKYLVTDDGGAKVMEFVSKAGGQLKAKNPELVPYYEAGFNLLLDLGRNNGANFESIVSKLDIPQNLRIGTDDKLKWANRIHEYFEDIIAKR